MATTTLTDDLTATAVRRALALAAAGRVQEGYEVGAQAITQGGNLAVLNAMLGMFQFRLGALDEALQHLQVAHRLAPSDHVVTHNLVNTLIQLDRKTEALDIITDELVAADRSRQLLKVRGYLAQMTEQFDLAIRSYERIVAEQPDDCEMWNNLGNAYVSAGDPERAVEALHRATEIDPRAAPIRLNYANALVSAGKWDEAEDALRKMASDFPDDPKPLRELYTLLSESGREQDAIAAIQQAVERAPNDLELRLALASYLSYNINSAGAEEQYGKVLELDPGNSFGHLGLAVCFDLTNRTEDLSKIVRQAEDREVGPNAVNFMRALDYRRSKRFQEGLDSLKLVPEDLESSRRAHLMGQLLEGVGRYDEAFESYKLMNELMRGEAKPAEERAAAYRAMLVARSQAMTEEWVGSWREETQKDPRPAPVFLVGFPRSGTTLLDTMLMGHPRIEVLEEEPTLHKAFEVFQDYNGIPRASDEHIKMARDAYFEVAGKLTPLRPGNLLVDKNPLAMNALPFIRRLFPDARIILALRHPCDVLLSCYVTNFRMNDGMANFVQLETGAELYDISFSYFDRVQELMPIPTHNVIYEGVVENQDRELRNLFDFLQLDWHDAVLDHQSTARNRGRIKTASYSQVVEPIYRRSSGRWRNYRSHLEPIIPVLRPWAEKFGYEL